MKVTTRNCLLAAGLLILVGNQIPKLAFFPGAEAAPKEVFGSPNVAVDTYRNRKGSYVVFSDGRITSAKGDVPGDLGHPYADPDVAAAIKKSEDLKDKPKGSPNVAVKALVRTDATYILFADGSLRKPSNADAALGGSDGQKVLRGTIPYKAGGYAGAKGDGWTASLGSDGVYQVSFEQPFSKPPTVLIQPEYTVGARVPGTTPGYVTSFNESGFKTSDFMNAAAQNCANSISFVVVGE